MFPRPGRPGEVVPSRWNRPHTGLSCTVRIILAMMLRIAIVSRGCGKAYTRIAGIIRSARQYAIAVWTASDEIIACRETEWVELSHWRVHCVRVKIQGVSLEP